MGLLSSALVFEWVQSQGNLYWATWLAKGIRIQWQKLLQSPPHCRPNPPLPPFSSTSPPLSQLSKKPYCWLVLLEHWLVIPSALWCSADLCWSSMDSAYSTEIA